MSQILWLSSLSRFGELDVIQEMAHLIIMRGKAQYAARGYDHGRY